MVSSDVRGKGMTDAHRSAEHQAVITGDELARMPDRGPCELVDGRIVPMSPTNPEHGRIEANIAAELHRIVRAQNLGLVMTGEVGIFTRWAPDRVRGADVLFISHARYAQRTTGRGFLDVAPELVVEILSPDNPHIDTMQKVPEYLAIGVRLVLVVDPPSRSIAAYRPGGGNPQRYAEGEAMPCGDVLPGFEFPVAAAFE
jgi:Uma2 family endonuclease